MGNKRRVNGRKVLQRYRMSGMFFLIAVVFFVALYSQMTVVVHAEEEETGTDSSAFTGQLYARSAVLMDGDSGRVLYGKEADVPRPMASTTKIMTCILALEYMKDEQEVVEASEYSAGQPKVHLGVRAGEEYYLKDLLYSLMLESHNDSAVMIAEYIGGSVQGFASLMNEKVRKLGCEKTYFITPNGLDASDEEGIHSTTARELARIMKYCIHDSDKREEFLEITGTKDYSFTDVSGSRSFSCYNHNAFLSMMEGTVSGKTGFTADAGYCYVGALVRDGRTFIVALLACGWPGNKNYKWSDTRALMEYGLENYRYREIWKDIKLADIQVENGIPDHGRLSGSASAEVKIEQEPEGWKMLLRDGEEADIHVKLAEQIMAPAEAGSKVGEISYYLNGEAIGSWVVVAVDSVEKRDYRWCVRQIIYRYIKFNQEK